MTKNQIKHLLDLGENVSVEFKRCGGNIESDVYETVCSFSNRFGGDILLGVLDDGKIEGVSQKSAQSLLRNFISVVGNPSLFSPTLYLDPEIVEYEGKTLIHIFVPNSGEVISFKKTIYDRVNDSDVKVSSTEQIAQMYIRKQEIYTERKVYPYVLKDDLRLDLLSRVQLLAKNNAGGSHPWEEMDNDTLLKSAGLYTTDRVTGQKGFNLAAVMLLGKDEVIKEVCPAYVTDALVRKVNVDRYDDREIVDTNLIESFDRLFEFAKKHLPDKFYVEDAERKSLRNIIVREMLVNTLMHREFTSSYQAKFIIEKNRMFTENANRAKSDGLITPENLEPYPKNPLIANFFRNIGFADKLGSGTRKIFKYAHLYSGENPEFIEGDVFRTIVPLDEMYSFDAEEKNSEDFKKTEQVAQNTEKMLGNCRETAQSAVKLPCNCRETAEKLPCKMSVGAEKVYNAIKDNPKSSNIDLCKILNLSDRTVRNYITELKKLRLIQRVGSDKSGYWEITNSHTQGE